ncbi:MAG: aspartate/glutamate racemase family protein [Candidatus Methanodesulfokora washburnensis]|jgi:allantoin racemase
MRILVINPVILDGWDEKQEEEIYRSFASPETEIKAVYLPRGPASIETPEAHAEVIPLVLDVARRNHESFDAVLVNCFLDPGVDFLKGILKKPVVGPCEASLSLAYIAGTRISIITVGTTGYWMIEERVKQLDLSNKVTSVRGIPVGVLDIDKDRAAVVSYLVNEAEKARKEERADVIVLGCTGLAGLAKEVQEKTNIFTIDPIGAAIKVAEALVKLGITGLPYRR